VVDCSGAVSSEVGGFRAGAVVSSNKLIASLVYLALSAGRMRVETLADSWRGLRL